MTLNAGLVLALLSLAACAAGPTLTTEANAAPGYRYHDSNHMGGMSQTSPQAIYNATHGTWLWPPAENGRPN